RRAHRRRTRLPDALRRLVLHGGAAARRRSPRDRRHPSLDGTRAARFPARGAGVDDACGVAVARAGVVEDGADAAAARVVRPAVRPAPESSRRDAGPRAAQALGAGAGSAPPLTVRRRACGGRRASPVSTTAGRWRETIPRRIPRPRPPPAAL